MDTLSGSIKAAEYETHTKYAFNDMEKEQKEQIPCYDSEKLAIAFGLIDTSPGTTIRVIKDLGVFGDCNSAIKFISKLLHVKLY